MLNRLHQVNLTASLAWAPPSGRCPPPWPSDLRVEWACSWDGQSCGVLANHLDAVLAEAYAVNSTASASASWASTLSLPSETLPPSLAPYIFSATLIVGDGVLGGRPLLRRELRVRVERARSGGESEDDDDTNSPQPLAERRAARQLMDGAEGLPTWQRGKRAKALSAIPGRRSPLVSASKFALRLSSASADAGGWALEVSEPAPPFGGWCHMRWDGREVGGLLMAVLLECGGWIGRDADAYPLAYKFGLQYRYAKPSLRTRHVTIG